MTLIEHVADVLGHPATAAVIGMALGVCAFRFLHLYGKKTKAEDKAAVVEQKHLKEIAKLKIEIDRLRSENRRIGAERFAAIEDNKILCAQLRNARHATKQIAKGAANIESETVDEP